MHASKKEGAVLHVQTVSSYLQGEKIGCITFVKGESSYIQEHFHFVWEPVGSLDRFIGLFIFGAVIS